MSNIFDLAKDLDTAQVAQRFGMELTRRAGTHWARCPWHNDSNPSMKIYPGNRGVYCFSCHKSGSNIDLVAQLEGIDPLTAAKRICDTFGIKYDDNRHPDATTTAAWHRQKQVQEKARALGEGVRPLAAMLNPLQAKLDRISEAAAEKAKAAAPTPEEIPEEVLDAVFEAVERAEAVRTTASLLTETTTPQEALEAFTGARGKAVIEELKRNEDTTAWQ